MGFKMVISSEDKYGKGVGAWIRNMLKKKLGNPIIPSKEKEQIKELEKSQGEDSSEDMKHEMEEEKPTQTSMKKRKTGFRAMA